MRIAIFLRNAGINRFRRAILAALQAPAVDEALLCSGFFQDDHKYSAGSDLKLHKHRACAPIQLTTLGLYSYTWRAQYAAFCGAIRSANPCSCVTLHQMRMPKMGWHAKVCIAKCKGKPAFAAIGSSNMTRRAFGEFPEFNFECDIVMWDGGSLQIELAVSEAMTDSGQSLDVVMARYDADHPVNRVPLADRLLTLDTEIRTLAKPV